jgi:methylenetetrahydrofolate--tRNA-(uracil-5-)-methyltransferase
VQEQHVVSVVGAGLAGSECALQLAKRDVRVRLYEQRPAHMTPAHHTAEPAELVCSNSFKSTRPDSAAGLLKEELARMDCELLKLAHKASVPAGGALAVDRVRFSALVKEALAAHPSIEYVEAQVDDVPEGPCVIAAGPLCSDELFQALGARLGTSSLAFYDAAAPIVDAQTLDRSVIFEQSRYGEANTGDYLNCPMNKEEYEAFITELLAAKRTIGKDFEQKDLFCACQPIEEVARAGRDAPRFGALKPVGLVDPRTGRRPWACVQLRAENEYQSAYNLVGFQTNLTWPEQKRVFSMIPGLENATYFRYGVMHRNSFVDAPHTLDPTFAIPGTQARLAGQICGTEGYVEAIASGLLAALNTVCDLNGWAPALLPEQTAFGALCAYATNPATEDYQPMHVNFGLMPPLTPCVRNKKERYGAYAARAVAALDGYIASRPELFAAEKSHA